MVALIVKLIEILRKIWFDGRSGLLRDDRIVVHGDYARHVFICVFQAPIGSINEIFRQLAEVPIPNNEIANLSQPVEVFQLGKIVTTFDTFLHFVNLFSSKPINLHPLEFQ